MARIRFALIGAGGMARTFHYPSLAEFADVELAALCDLVPQKREALADRFGISRRFGDYREMLEEVKPDAVCAFMPPHLLFDLVMDCLQQGIHVFVEKPPGVTTFQTEAWARAAAEHNCMTMVGFNRRHDPLIKLALEHAHERGPVIQAQATFFKAESAIYYRGAIDVLTCDAIHAVDTLRYLGGSRVAEVSALVGQYDAPVTNAWNALVRFENGATGILQSNWSTGGRIHRFEVHSRGYSAYVEQLTAIEELVQQDRSRTRRTAEEVLGPAAEDPRKRNGFYQQARHFVDCIQEGCQPSASFADALLTMQLVDAIRMGGHQPPQPLRMQGGSA